MKKIKSVLIPLCILVVTAVVIFLIVNNPPKNMRSKGKTQTHIVVDVITLKAREFTMEINSYGVVRPRTQSMLVAQVSGEISYVSDQFRDGGFFEKGELLLQIDDRDYQAEVKIVQATLLSAEQALLEEQARSEQALADWHRLGNGAQANSLVLREPQLAAQRANVLSAEAKLEKAQLALERTRIIAPFSGRVLNKQVDLGQVISNNGQLAQVYAVDYVEVRLPINNSDLRFINLPEQSRDGVHNGQQAIVTLSSDLVGYQQWQGTVIRTEGAINEQSQQLYVVAQITDPYAAKKLAEFPIKIGQYVNAKIAGKTIPHALTIPNNAIYQGSYVYVLNEQNLLMRKAVEAAWQNQELTLVRSGLSAGDRLVITPLGQVSSGTKVTVSGSAQKQLGTPDQDLSSRRQKKLDAIAKKRGISVEQVLLERKQVKAQGEGV